MRPAHSAERVGGIERGTQHTEMDINVKGKTCVFVQSHSDPRVWSMLRGSVAPEGRALRTGAALPRERCPTERGLATLPREGPTAV